MSKIPWIEINLPYKKEDPDTATPRPPDLSEELKATFGLTMRYGSGPNTRNSLW